MTALEAIPLLNNSVDVVISNCVIDLSGDRTRAARTAPRLEAQLAVYDVTKRGGVPEVILTEELAPRCRVECVKDYIDGARAKESH